MDSHSASRALSASESLVTQRDEIVFRMEEITRALRQAFERRIAQTGLTRTQWRILAYLLREQGQTQSDLARLLDLERATVGQAIDRMENLKLVERRPHHTDRRVWQVHLCDAAFKLVPFLRDEADRLHDQTWADMADEDIATLERLLDKLAGNLACSDYTRSEE
jgi:DNA-binding MarR family transcriptional regulator